MKGKLFSFYQRLPNVLKSVISKIAFRPEIGKQVGLYGNILYGPSVSIGDYSYINKDSYVSNARIGKFCSIGKNFSIITSNRFYTYFSTYPFGEQYNSPLKGRLGLVPVKEDRSDVVIGNDVWVGENVSVLVGVTIGNGAVIAANSFVNKDIPPYAIGGGIPCKVIKYRFSEEIIEKLEHIKWWDKHPDEIYKLYHELMQLVKKED